MIYSKATHNFITKYEAKRLGLKLKKDVGKMKTVKSQTSATVWLAKQVKIKFREWEGCTNIMVVSADDFNIILGMEFMMEKNHPCTNCKESLEYKRQHECYAGKDAKIKEIKALICFKFKKSLKRYDP